MADGRVEREACERATTPPVVREQAATPIAAPPTPTRAEPEHADLEGQDLTGLDRARVKELGHDYLDQAILAAGSG